MQDLYVEQIVKANRSRKVHGTQKGLFVLIVLLAVITLLLYWFFIAPLVIVAVYTWYYNRKIKYEYEYVFVNGELCIDVVKPSRRKRLGTFTMEELVCMAPADSNRLDGYKGQIQKKIKAVTGSTGRTVYAMIFRQEQKQIEVLVEPEEELMKMFRLTAPNKIM